AQSLAITNTYKIPCYAEVQPSATSLAKTIADKANGYDLVIMGTNGADNLFQFFYGSNAYNAILITNIPVLLIPESCPYTEIENIAYAYDYLSERKLPIQQLIPLISMLEA